MSQQEKPPPCIHNTPALKIALRDELIQVVYSRSYTKFAQVLDDIQMRNATFMGYSIYAFTYKSVYYGPTIMPTKDDLQKMNLPPRSPVATGIRKQAWDNVHAVRVANRALHAQQLAPGFHAEMDQLLADKKELELEELPMVQATLTSVLNSSPAITDYEKLLPAICHPLLDEVRGRCSCAVQSLTDEQLERVRTKHGRYINIIAQRQLLYLIAPP